MRFPIRYQFMLPLLAVSLLSLVAIGWISAGMITQRTTARIEQRLQNVLAVLAQSNFPLTDQVLRQMGGLASAELILTDHNGEIVAASHDLPLAVGENLSALPAAGDQVLLSSTVQVGDKAFFHSTVPVRQRAGLQQGSQLHVLFGQDEYNAAWRAVFLPPLGVGLATAAIVVLITFGVARRLSRMLASLGHEVNRLARGDYSPLAEPPLDDETRDLAKSINQTAEQLGEYEQQLRQSERARTVAMIGAGLAHEMRNAATGCRLAVDLHAKSCPATDNDEALQVARHQLEMMESRLQQLLQLGATNTEDSQELLDYAEIIDRAVRLIAPAAQHAGVRLDWKPPERATQVLANAELLTQAVSNLLLNALEAARQNQLVSAAEGFVRVEVLDHQRETELLVTDSGSGPQDAGDGQQAFFQPFVTSKPEGVGLGLTVARRVIESFGGEIAWQRQAGLTQFSIRLPHAQRGLQHV